MDLGIEGLHALLFDDDANAAFVNSRTALVPWNGDESLLIDRYDVRHLLDRIPPRPKKQKFVEDTGGVSKSELDSERYLVLSLDEEDELESETTERSAVAGSGSYQAVHFSYGNEGPNSSITGSNDSSFRPPFPVPTSLLGHLPPTEKLHQIMARTAIFVSEHGGQSEIVLRVKQGDNPTFGFLMSDNELHPYFRFLVDRPQLLRADNNSQEEKKTKGEESEGALSLLGSLYGTGEDDDSAPQHEFKEVGPDNQNNAVNIMLPQKSVTGEPSSLSLEAKEPIKRTISATIKERSLIPKRNHFVHSATISKKGEGSTGQHGIMEERISHPGKTDTKAPVLEPPSFLKRTMDKIVEFILRNGKEFEAVLVERDKTAGRFPFLLPSNQYHCYYCKVLDEALESKLLSKNQPDLSKRKPQQATPNESTTDELPEGWSLDPQRKEKFKMFIGSKRDSLEQPSKPIRNSGVSTDEVAAIVLAATRGRSPAFQSMLAADSADTRPNKPGYGPTLSNATAIAKTVALATSSEADSSEALMTKEQKLKAERLKRAKMFAAMIQSGVNPAVGSVHSSGTPNGCVDQSNVGSNHEEREGSSAALFDAGASGQERNYRRKRDSTPKHHGEDFDEGNDNKPSGKKHRKDNESKHHRSSPHHRKYHKHHSDLEDEESQEKSHHRHHRHHNHRDSESDGKNEMSSKHGHRHRKHDLSEEENRERSSKHRSKHRSRSERKEEIEDEDNERSFGLSKEKSEEITRVSDAKPSVATDIPSDLRAKIRAMLLETM